MVVVAERERQSAATRQRLGRVRSLASRREALDRVLAGLRDRRQRLEIEQTENRVRHEAAVTSLRRDLELGPDELGEAPLPHLGEEADAAARLAIVEAELATLGAVNPLAQAELTELEERSRFLEVQLDDVRSARRELGQVISSIDHEIAEVFTAAYADIARHFSDLFTTLFPGGVGRLSLTAPDDPLSTGIEIEARPAGRNVRRLSLLSGGERSLVALAFLFAVFRSRPSPFYLMDEVEAALDEVNLRRFLDLVDEFRDEAQLLIVSHQKRTMEVADALFGVTMQPGGSSKVVSEKLRRGRHARADHPVEVR
jgi:chromosome segregation protein